MKDNVIVLEADLDFKKTLQEASRILNQCYSTLVLDFSLVELLTTPHLAALLAIADKTRKVGCRLFLKDFRQDFLEDIDNLGFGNVLLSANIDTR